MRLKAEVDNGNVIVSSLADVDFKTPRGYKFVGWEEDNGKIYQPGGLFKVNVNNENKNVFKAKWAEDPDQTKTLKYTVEHKIGNTLKHSQDYTKDVWVNDPDRLTIQEGSLDPKTTGEFKGYKLGSIDPATSEVGNPVAHGSTITLNYVKDESQQKTLKYTVEHKIGNTLKHSQDYTKDVW